MEASEITDLFKFAIPFIILYNAYIHNQVVKNAKDIAVNSANDKNRNDNVSNLIKKVDRLTDKVDNLILIMGNIKTK